MAFVSASKPGVKVPGWYSLRPSSQRAVSSPAAGMVPGLPPDFTVCQEPPEGIPLGGVSVLCHI